jgi:hypothetical protein
LGAKLLPPWSSSPSALFCLVAKKGDDIAIDQIYFILVLNRQLVVDFFQCHNMVEKIKQDPAAKLQTSFPLIAEETLVWM